EITIQFDKGLVSGNVNFEIFDVLGNSILKKEMKNQNSTKIDVSEFASGIYFLKTTIISKNNNLQQKVVRFVVSR
ncbi:MAG: T9SS type A sorting domain-containing protein, partial [Bacteroidetes bacterium]|nr:T9SS type A sorting domain-containing protein [Bacteroidota bacterium]